MESPLIYSSAFNNAVTQLHAASEQPGSVECSTLAQLVTLIYRVLDSIPSQTPNLDLDIITPLIAIAQFHNQGVSQADTGPDSGYDHLVMVAVWKALTNVNVQKHTVPVLGTLRTFKGDASALQSRDGLITSMTDLLYARYNLGVGGFGKISDLDTSAVLQLSGIMASKVDKVFAQIGDHDHTKDVSKLFESLECLVELLIGENQEICTLVTVLHPDFSKLGDLYTEQNTLSGVCKLISNVLHIISRILIPRYPEVYQFHHGCLAKFANSSHEEFTRDNPESLQNSVRCVLELLDHGSTLHYLRSTRLINSLHLSLNTLLSQPRLKLNTQFNLSSSKISLVAGLTYLNYLIGLNLMNGEQIKLATPIVPHFKQFMLPPLPKGSWFIPDPYLPVETEIPTGMSAVQSQNLWTCMLMNLELISQNIEDEFRCGQYICENASESLQKKLVFRRIDLILASLSMPLVLSQGSDSSFISKEVRRTVQDIVFKILNIELEKVAREMLWVCLINFANDLCYSDLAFLEVFHDLFESLVMRDESVLKDGLVRSGLEFFNSTFDYCAKLSEAQLVPISLQNFSFLYEARYKKQTFDKSEGSPKLPTQTDSSRGSYATNSARKQSVHIDQFGP